MRWYVGIKSANHYVAFRYAYSPTELDDLPYLAVIGPFTTKRAALWAEKYGPMNPHFRHVNDAEHFSREGK
jgi:hypothetical protein